MGGKQLTPLKEVDPHPVSFPHKDGTKNHSIEIHQISATTFSGPLPPPEIMQGYDQIVPGAADRIITIFESEVSHRQKMEEKQLDADIKDKKVEHTLTFSGMLFGLIVSISLITVGGFLIYHDKAVAGYFVCISSMAGIIAAFLSGKKKNTPPVTTPPAKKKRTR